MKENMAKQKKDIKIFVSHRIDLDSEIIDNPLYVPVRCGAVYDNREHVEMLGDNTGDNISRKRETFCELTVQYWAWKNVEADYYGLCHYRRYMVFSDTKHQEDIYGSVSCEYLDSDTIEKIGLNDSEQIYKVLENTDFAYTTPFNVTKDKEKFNNLYDQYTVLPTLHLKDLKLAVSVIKELYPEYYPYAKQYLEGQMLIPCCMFIMKREIFHEYSEWLFNILFELERRLDISNYGLEECRGIAHIGERLLGVFITFLMKNRKQLKHVQLQRVLFWNTNSVNVLTPYFAKNNIPVVMASSELFIPYLAITLQSLLENASKEFNYDVVILNTEVSEKLKMLLKKSILQFDNVHVRFFDVSSYLKGIKLHSQSHASVETFYRLLVQKLFINYKKIVYLDSDLIICDDIANLYNIDLEDNLLGATVDADFCGEYNGGNPPIKKYCDEILKLKNPYHYFQAGVVVFNIVKMKQYFAPDELVEFANGTTFIYVDQDVLNTKCEGKVHHIDMEWNVLHDCAAIRINSFIKRAPRNIYKRYIEARKRPKIIHYAGFEKPWTNSGCDFSDTFWSYARRSIFYEMIMQRMMFSSFAGSNYSNQNNSFARRYADKWFRKGSKRRELLKFFIPRDSIQWILLKRFYHTCFY